MSRSGPVTRTALVAGLTAVAFIVVVAVPTNLIDTPLFSRAIPPTWWAWPSLVASSVLGGLLVATSVGPAARPADVNRGSSRRGLVAVVLTYLAVGCPVCNKLALVALGATGAVTWFAPFQPVLQVAALALLAWALVLRLRTRDRCPVPAPASQESR
jgi:hypothetical protein